jgi:hypothetical protein
LVPVEPNTAMKRAGSLVNGQGFDFAHHTWVRMLAAATQYATQPCLTCDICNGTGTAFGKRCDCVASWYGTIDGSGEEVKRNPGAGIVDYD